MSNMTDLWIYGFQVCFSGSKYNKTRFWPEQRAPDPAGGAYRYDAPLDAPSRLGIFPTPSTPSASRSRRIRRLGCQAPNTNSWLRL